MMASSAYQAFHAERWSASRFLMIESSSGGAEARLDGCQDRTIVPTAAPLVTG